MFWRNLAVLSLSAKAKCDTGWHLFDFTYITRINIVYKRAIQTDNKRLIIIYKLLNDSKHCWFEGQKMSKLKFGCKMKVFQIRMELLPPSVTFGFFAEGQKWQEGPWLGLGGVGVPVCHSAAAIRPVSKLWEFFHHGVNFVTVCVDVLQQETKNKIHRLGSFH